MSEDSSFIGKKKPQINTDERRCGVDICGSLGKGMLTIESLRNAPGLTPLHFGFYQYNKNVNGGTGFSTTEITENTELIRNSSGLTPLSIGDRIHKRGVI